ncbi:hypothetical protein DSCW_67160 [Desulfosarcina widdelii]|uniref:Uncharacterized protein n=1 Tax=Desulfosarcina widdelii TaxID=947919 RepID=A0A5K7ZGK3_9BACT|nr:hypothetical protein DSCW_67160 [Desulfosarcina widdelii]
MWCTFIKMIKYASETGMARIPSTLAQVPIRNAICEQMSQDAAFSRFIPLINK